MLATLAWVLLVPLAAAQTATGEIYGRVTDATGGVLPGVTVTIASPVLLQALTAVTTETGAYRFPLIPIGTYSARFDIAGFRALVREGIRIEIGLNAQTNATLELGSVEQVIQVAGGSPLIDRRDTATSSRFGVEALQAIPSARDPWAILAQTAGVAMDRQNVGGSTSGQQGNFVARGTVRESKWSLDGVDITDMYATGSSPVYYDFDAFEEIRVTTGGADVTMAPSGVVVNLVTKSGTDTLRGSGRFYVTDDAFEANNVTAELRRQGVYTGNPIQNIKDYGVEAGGPLVKGRAWLWGGYGTQRINTGVNNVYRDDADCQAMKADPLQFSLEQLQACLVTDTTILKTFNLKFALQLARRNQFSFLVNAANKTRPTRELSDLRPLSTSLRQHAVTRAELGSRWWTIGIPKTYKWSDRHIFSDRFVAEGQYAHVGNNFIATFHDESLRGVQPSYEATTGAYDRSYVEDVNVRPADIVELTGSYLLPGVLYGDHALRFGFQSRNDLAHKETMVGGDAAAVFANGAAGQAQLYRRAIGEYGLHNRSLYLQDSFTRPRITLNAGLRFDHQHDYAKPAAVPASPFYGQPTYAGMYRGIVYPGAAFNQLPSVAFAGAGPDVSFNTFSPRAGVSVDLTGTGRTVLKVSFARYVGQLGAGNGPIAMVGNPGTLTSVTYPWVDLNGDRFVQANEIVLTGAPLSWTTGYDYANPSKTAGTVDASLSADRTTEIIVSVDRQFASEFAVTASYIWRRYGNARWNDTTDWTSADYARKTYAPSAGECPDGARCSEVTYYQPVRQIPVGYVLANQPDFWRGYNGFELTARKRLAGGWMLNASVSYNDARVHYDSPGAYEDPTNIANLDGAQYAPQYATDLSSARVGNTFVNATWIFRVSGSYCTPLWGINVAGFYDSRSGYPFAANIQTPLRPYGAGYAYVYLDRLGDNRLPVLHTLDLRVDRRFTVGRLRVLPAMDVFNLLNAGTPLSIRPVQNASNANRISSILAPRVVRFGLRVEW